MSRAVAQAGLPASSVPLFAKALLGGDATGLSKVPGVTPAIIQLGVSAFKQTFAYSMRVVFIIAAPFGALACLSCCFLGDLRSTMNYHVDAPMEKLHLKANRANPESSVTFVVEYPIRSWRVLQIASWHCPG